MRETVSLRKLEERDAEQMLEWMHDSEIPKNFKLSLQNMGMEDVKQFIKNAENELIDGKSLHYAIVDVKDEYLGTISLKNINLVDKNAEYAVSLRRKAHGKGIGTAATKKVLALAFEEFGLNRIYLNVLEENITAIKLYEKCGFKYEGAFKKHLYLNGKWNTLIWYAILKSEYSNNIVE